MANEGGGHQAHRVMTGTVSTDMMLDDGWMGGGEAVE